MPIKDAAEIRASVAELLAAYPDVSVARGRDGSLAVYAQIGEEEKRLSISLKRDNPEQELCDLLIAIPPEKESGGEWRYIQVCPRSDNEAVARSTNLSPEYDLGEVVSKVKQGVELFDTAVRVGFVDVPQQRAYDWMQAGDDNFVLAVMMREGIKALESGSSISETDKDELPSRQYRYMMKILNREIMVG